MFLNAALLKDYSGNSNKTIEQVITDTAILSEICELLRLYLYKSNYYSRVEFSVQLKILNEEESIIKQKNAEAKNIYYWLHGREFNINDCGNAEVKHDPKKLLKELKSLVKCWDEDDDTELIEEGIINAFRSFTIEK